MNVMTNYTGKTILIIGASSGIGRRTAIQLSELGARIVLVARREDRLNQVLSELHGCGHSYFSVDMAQVDLLENLFKRTKEEIGPLDGMVYTAGMTATMPLKMLKPEKLQSVLTVHFVSFVEAVRQFSKKGFYNENARIVVMSSVSARCGDRGHTAYASAKAAIEAAVRCLANELVDKGICINAVEAGMTRTEMLDDFLKNNGEDSDAYRKIVERQYLGLGNPDDIANVISFLLSPAARFITGAVIPVDGGYTAC